MLSALVCRRLFAPKKHAKLFNISSARVLISNGIISEHDYFQCVAFHLGLEFVHQTKTDTPPFFTTPKPATISKMARMVRSKNESQIGNPDPIHLAPNCREIRVLKKMLARSPELAARLKITTLTENKKAIESRCAPSLLAMAVNGLRERFPLFSARRVITPTQAIVLVLMLQTLIVLSLFSSNLVLLGLHLTASAFYFGCIALRFIATITFSKSARMPQKKNSIHAGVNDYNLPTYTILVALYHEADQVDDLTSALLRLDWPRERLEIKLIL